MVENLAHNATSVLELWDEIDSAHKSGDLKSDLLHVQSLLSSGKLDLARQIVLRWQEWCTATAEDTPNLILDMQLTNLEVEFKDMLDVIDKFALDKVVQLEPNLERVVRVKGEIVESEQGHLLDSTNLIANFYRMADKETVVYAKSSLEHGFHEFSAKVIVVDGRRKDEHVREFQLVLEK